MPFSFICFLIPNSSFTFPISSLLSPLCALPYVYPVKFLLMKSEAYFTGAYSILFLILKSAKICVICGCAVLFALCPMRSALSTQRLAINLDRLLCYPVPTCPVGRHIVLGLYFSSIWFCISCRSSFDNSAIFTP